MLFRSGDRYRTVFYGKSGHMKDLIAIKDKMEAVLEAENSRTETVQFDFDPMNCY